MHRLLPLAILCLALLGCGKSTPRPETDVEKVDREFRELVARNLAHLKQTNECEGCELANVDLAGADLRGARLARCRISMVDLRNADLRNADLTQANLDADLRDADLRGAKTEGVSLAFGHHGVESLRGARLDGLDLRTVRFADATTWNGAVLRDANLSGVRFCGMYGSQHRGPRGTFFNVPNGCVSMVEADLRGANLRDAGLGKSLVHRSDFRGANLTGVRTFDKGELVHDLGPDWEGALLEGAIFEQDVVCGPGSIGRCVVMRGTTSAGGSSGPTTRGQR